MEKLPDLVEYYSKVTQISDEITDYINTRNTLTDKQYYHIIYEVPNWIFKLDEYCSKEEKNRLGIPYVLIEKGTKISEKLIEIDELKLEFNHTNEIEQQIKKNYKFLTSILEITKKDISFIKEKIKEIDKIEQRINNIYIYKEDKNLLTKEEVGVDVEVRYASEKLYEIDSNYKQIKYIHNILPLLNF